VIDLARRLDELGAELEFPTTPDLVSAVLPRLVRRRRGRRLLVAALAALALVGAVLAVSPRARSAVLDGLGVGGVRIVEVDELPVVPVREEPFLGERVSLAEARRRIAFPVLLLPADSAGSPDEVYVRSYPSGGAVTLVYGSARRPRLLLSQWRGGTYEPVLRKTVGPDAEHETLTVGGGPGIWLSGAPHIVFSHRADGEEFEETLYLVGHVLVWERGARSFRLEADVDKEEALELAASLR
jgi:hypothetical protein